MSNMVIKFRGFRTDGKGWVYGFYWASLDPHSEETRWRGHFIHDGCSIAMPVPIHPESLGMFTGLHDKNGKEIFGAIGERGGDRISFGRELTYFVKFVNGSFQVFHEMYKEINDTPLRWGALYRAVELQWDGYLEIIGNQWEVNNGN